MKQFKGILYEAEMVMPSKKYEACTAREESRGLSADFLPALPSGFK